MTPSPPNAPSERSPGRTFFWVGGMLVAVAAVLVVGGFLLPFLLFPFRAMANPDAVPEPGAFAGAFGGVAAGFGAMFAGFVAGVVGSGLLIAGLVRHSRWRRDVDVAPPRHPDRPGAPPRPPTAAPGPPPPP